MYARLYTATKEQYLKMTPEEREQYLKDLENIIHDAYTQLNLLGKTPSNFEKFKADYVAKQTDKSEDKTDS